ncbi:MAG: hypothetical protein Q8S73_11445 [Deltaproteobacteria bacterium]|nr:hypothetical protein [Myxococcales bacterium]MDP3214712.1 hypothetical protein [Deltaproteobacteria bacterium]
MRARLLALLAPVAAASCDGAPLATGDRSTVCGGFAGDASVTPGLGGSDFIELRDGAIAPQVNGSQGGSHVLVGARLRGFRSPVTLSVEARDAYSGARLGAAHAASAVAAVPADGPGDACDVRGMWLLLNALFPGGAGLADLTFTARDATGLTRTATRRAWIGRPLPSCAPDEGVGASLVPLTLASTTQRRDEALAITPGATLRASVGGEVLVGAAVLGMAASAVSLTARVFDDASPSRALLREVRAAAPAGDATVVPTPRRAAPECVAPVTLRLPVDPTMGGRPLRLSLTADDGLGHARTEEREVRFATVTADAGTPPPPDAPPPDAPSPDAGAPDAPSLQDASLGADAAPDATPDAATDAAPDVATPTGLPSGLRLLSAQSFGFGAHARELAVDGDTVYLADSNGLPVVGLAEGSTRLVHPIAAMREQHCSTASLHARSRTLVCGAGDSGFLDLVDVSNPSRPRSRPWDINAHDPGGGTPVYEVADVEVVDDTAWMAAQSNGLLRLSLGGDGMPTALARTGVGADLVGVVSDRSRLALIDRVEGLTLRALPGLGLIAAAPLDGPPLDVAMSGDRVAVALGSNGARVFRAAGSALTPWVGVQPRCVATAVALSGDLLAVACLTGVTLYDLRGAAPRVAGFYPARYGMLDVAFTPRGLVASDWYGLDLFAVDPAGVARTPDVPLALRLRPGADAPVGLRNPGPDDLALTWRALTSTGVSFGGALSIVGGGDAVLTLPFAATGMAVGAAGSLDVTFSAGGEAAARTHVAWRAATDAPAAGVVAIGDRFPTLRRTVATPFAATLPPPGAATLVMFLTVDCYLQWPQLEDMAWSRAHDRMQPEPTVLYLTTEDQDPFDPLMFMRAHAAAALPTFEWADYSRSVPGQESETNFVRAFESTFMMRLPGSDFPHDYLVAADGTTLDTLRSFRGRWALPR